MQQGKFEITFQPLGRHVEVEAKTTLLAAAQIAGVGLAAVCGGAGVCGQCKVRVVEGNATRLTGREREFLDEDELANGYRLACLSRPRSDMIVDVPLDSLSAPQRTQIEGEGLDVELQPAVEGVDVELQPATQEDLRGDLTRLSEAVGRQTGRESLHADLPVIGDLTRELRADKERGWKVRAMVRGREVVGVHKPGRVPLGFAVDLGTTKMAGYLVNLETGETFAAIGRMNPQIKYGEDVLARIRYAMESRENAQRLQDAVIEGLSEMIETMCRESAGGCGPVVDMVLVGNTAMHHLFLGLPVDQLGTAPYVAALTDPIDVKARELGLPLSPGAYVHLLPNIAGFVGGDHVAMLLATNTPNLSGVTIALDIGTNTEISLNNNGTMYSCSTASGPAFEGAHIRDGMRAADGAIERFRLINGKIEYQTIANLPPVGLCGSGILDAVAELRRAEVLSLTGAVQAANNHRVKGEGHKKAYIIADASESGTGRSIQLSRSDVNEIQMAKGAMRSGVRLLMDAAGIEESDIDRFIIAGAFGTYIDVRSAVTIGMFPPLPFNRFVQVGNAAGMGAKQALLSLSERKRALAIARQSHYVELTNVPRFADVFAQAVMLTPDCWSF